MLHIVQYVNPIIARKIEIIWLNVCSSHIFFVSLQPKDNKRHEYDEDIQYDRQMHSFDALYGGHQPTGGGGCQDGAPWQLFLHQQRQTVWKDHYSGHAQEKVGRRRITTTETSILPLCSTLSKMIKVLPLCLAASSRRGCTICSFPTIRGYRFINKERATKITKRTKR